jgi:hypothetical protein
MVAVTIHIESDVTDDNDDQYERRLRYGDDVRLYDIQHTVNDLDKRVAVVETRQESFEHQMTESLRHLDEKIEKVDKGVSAIGHLLTSHSAAEDADRKTIIKTLSGILATILLGVAAYVLQYLVSHGEGF